MSKYSTLITDLVDFGTNKSNPRTEPISKITIHHMASISTGKDCALSHLNSSDRDASANYYIGNAGDICGGVSEDRRAWTSGSSWNDQRAITIEVSNSTGEPSWGVSPAAYAATIKLCIDICKRYHIIPSFNGTQNGTLTAHYMFQATSCPGPTWKSYLSSKKVENDIKKGLDIQPTPSPMTDEEKIWGYYYNKIGNAYGVAGLMGNLYAESGLRSNNLQNTYEKSLHMSDEQYTAAVDNGTYTNFIHDKAGYGLAQWTFWSRKQGLYNFRNGRSIGDLVMQMDYLWQELTTKYPTVLHTLQTAKSVYEASTAVLIDFERPSDQSDTMKSKRAAYSQVYYDKYASGSKPIPPSGSFIVRIIVDELNVRSGPSTTYPIVTTVHYKSAYTITTVQGEWGKLLSGVGWINLNYTERV